MVFLVLRNLQFSSSSYASSCGILRLMGYKAAEVEGFKRLGQTFGVAPEDIL